MEAGSMDAGREAGTGDTGGRRADAPLRAQARERRRAAAGEVSARHGGGVPRSELRRTREEDER